MKFKIATGRSKKELKWKNVEWDWKQLTEKLKDTYRTRETVEEYRKMKPVQQGNIKDIGGFVGGWLEGGRRKSDTVLCRSLLTLDADFASKTFWEDLELLQDYKCCIYSTHKHTPEAPRLRLIIPLKRTVTPEEYEAVSRLVAKDLNIEMFDDTTYQPSRLMYWPSTPKNGQFVYEEQDGPLLDPDAILARYHDWKDVSFWPQSSRVKEIHVRQAKKQGDPLEKEGLIGAFCRTYDIHQAINKFLSDIYTECGDDRYTYNLGSTAAGLVVYEDKWAYSNHGTDPASGKLCNAFDLVRIHLFGEEDEKAKEDTPVNKLPSYVKMMDFIAEDEETKAENISGFFIDLDEALEHLEDDQDQDKKSDKDWIKKLEIDRKGNILSLINNVSLILENDPELKNIKGLNLFNNRIEIVGKLPWYKHKESRSWRDDDSSGLRKYLEKKYKFKGKDNIKDAFTDYARRNEFHPVRDYLDSLIWDGEKRIDTLLIDYLGAEDCEYTRIVTRRWLIGAVARIYEPGCKMDNALILVGDQGTGKSTLAQKLAVNINWFNDTKLNMKDKSALEQIRGKWIVELQELAGMAKVEIEDIKAFISGRVDSFRAAYKENTEDNFRQNVFIGTTNKYEFLRDLTGNRRFWPVDINTSYHEKNTWDLSDEDIAQIWAEAKKAYKSGEKWAEDAKLKELAKEVQEAHVDTNELASVIEEYLSQELPANWEDLTAIEKVHWFEQLRHPDWGTPEPAPGGYYRDRVSIREVWTECLQRNISDLKDRKSQGELKDAMAAIKGWVYRKSVKFKDRFSRGYVKI